MILKCDRCHHEVQGTKMVIDSRCGWCDDGRFQHLADDYMETSWLSDMWNAITNWSKKDG